MSRLNPKPALASHRVLDRRCEPRYSVQIPVEIQVKGCETALFTETTDLSRHGCYVRLRSPLPVGLWVVAILRLNTVPVRTEGRIVTRHPELGNGIMFLKIQDSDERALTAYLEAAARESTF